MTILRHMLQWRVVASVIVLTVVSGCGEPSNGSVDLVIRDSAGVRMTESPAPRWEAGQGWRLATSPALAIGEEEGDPEYLFNGIAGVQRLSDGRIAVADAGSGQIRFYDETGRHLRTAGGTGEGPGEFQFMGSMWTLPDDTIVVTDFRGVSTFDAEGRFVRITTFPLAEGQYRGDPAGQSADGRFLVVSGSRGFGPNDAGTVIRDSLRFYWYEADGSFGGLITILPSAERWGLNAGGRITFPYLPFAARPVWAAADGRFYVGSGREPAFSVWQPDGRLEGSTRWQRPAPPVDDGMRDRFRTHLLASARDDNARRREETFLAEAPTSTRLPSHQSILADADGNAWVELYRPAWEVEPEWDIVTQEGRWLGTVRTPARFRPFQIGRDFVLGVSRDDLGVERVHLFELVKDPQAISP